MTSTFRWLFVAGTALALSLSLTPRALACKCMMPEPQAAKEQAAAVFEGRVTSVEKLGGAAEGMGKLVVTLALVRTWKGLENEETVKVRTNDSTAACGIDFEEGKSYLVYASQGAEGLEAFACGRTRPMAHASDDLAALGGGVTPVKIANAEAPKPAERPTSSRGTGCGTRAAAGSQAAALFGLLPGLVVLSRRRRG